MWYTLARQFPVGKSLLIDGGLLMVQPLIKKSDADDLFAAGKSFNFQSVEERARAIVAEARAAAAEEVRRAKLEIEKMREEVRGEEFELARKDGYDKGYEQGFSEGLEKGAKGAFEHRTKALNEQIGELPEIVKQIVHEVESRRKRLVEECDRDLLALSFAIAERLTRKKLESSPDTMREVMREAIDLVLNRATLDIFLAPQDLRAVEEFLPAMRKEFTDLGAVRMQADPQLTRGSVIVRAGRGQITASVDAQIEEVAQALLGTDAKTATARVAGSRSGA